MNDLQLLKAGQFYQLLLKNKERLGVWYSESPAVFAKLNSATPPKTNAAVWPWLLELVKSCEKEAALEMFVWALSNELNLSDDDFTNLYALGLNGQCSPEFRRRLRRGKLKVALDKLLHFVSIHNVRVITKAA